MEVDIGKMAQDCMNCIQDQFKNLKHLNIIIAGKTGVGKSTLINSVFRENLAETGVGSPVTTHMSMYTQPDFPLCIYDTRGFELGKNAQKEVKKEILNTIKKNLASKDPNKYIHCIWYCINANSDRVEEEEINWLKTFTEENKETQVPVIVVLTKAFSKTQVKKMVAFIKDKNLNVSHVIPVLAQDYEIDEGSFIHSYGLDTLIQAMGKLLDQDLLKTLMNVQKASLEEKVKHAHAIVTTAVGSTFVEGFAPIPFSDFALLVPMQVSMIAAITVNFGIEVNKGLLTTFVSSTLGASGATIAGKTIANFLKTIPGVGTLAGGMISGATAAILTTALGEAYIQFMVAVAKGEISKNDLESDAGVEKFKKLFKKQI